jgi:hypothetical protein
MPRAFKALAEGTVENSFIQTDTLQFLKSFDAEAEQEEIL